MSLFNSYDRTKFLDELNHPVRNGTGIVTPAQAKAKALTNLGAAASADIPVAATTATAGVVKQAAFVDGSTGTVADITAALIAAGIMAAS